MRLTDALFPGRNFAGLIVMGAAISELAPPFGVPRSAEGRSVRPATI